ncbi:MAG: hypothetical protein ACRDFZ_04070 [Candidatus Limnocylindria bacterium]
MRNGPEGRTLELLSVVAVAAILVGIRMLDGTTLGSSWEGALAEVASQLPVTFPAAVLVLGSAVIQLAAGAVVIRALRRAPYGSVIDAVLGGVVGAVVIGLVALMLLGSLGLFRQVVLLAVNATVIGLGWFVKPILASRPVLRLGWPTVAGALVVFAWSGSVILQLASPVVPFIDVLPNHVAPPEHLRAFGEFTTLTIAPSPIYGPSRMFLGYTGLLGSATVLSGQPAALATAAFVLPSTVLVALGMVRLASGIHGRGVAWWMLIAFTLTASFARMADGRATVLVLPLVAFCLVELVTGDEQRRPLVLAVGLAATLYLHPLMGVLTAATVAALVALAPERFARIGVPALVGGAVLALPQATTMLGLDLPSALGLLAIPPALGALWLLDRSDLARRGLILLVRGIGIAGVVTVVVFALPSLERWVNSFVEFFVRYPILVWTVAVGGIVAGRTTFALVPVVAFAMGLLAVLAAAAIRWQDLGVDGLDFEVSKTLHYWTPVFLAVMGAFALRAVWENPRFGLALRAGVVGIFLLAAALPIRLEPIEALLLGEHRISETLSIDLRNAETGYWVGYPDSRMIITPAQNELVERLRAEVAAGRLASTTPVLHVAFNFQQWDATPIGVFGGMLETMVSEQTEVSIHTAGGRLHPLEELNLLLQAGYPYVVFEPDDLPLGIRERIVGAGFVSLFVNTQGEIFVAFGGG